MTTTLSTDLSAFLDAVGREPLIALSVAESLTDDLAASILEETDLSTTAVDLLHRTDLVIERNSEWNLREDVRSWAIAQWPSEEDLVSSVNTRLLTYAERDHDSVGADFEIPIYLQSGVGYAYHGTRAGRAGARRVYGLVGAYGVASDKWLAHRLILEQTSQSLLGEKSLESLFLSGMLDYQEGRRAQALKTLAVVARRRRPRIECAIAAHLVGNDALRRGRRRSGTVALRWSLDTLRRLGDDWGVAQVEHSLGGHLAEDRKTRREGLELLRSSLDLGFAQHRDAHVAMVQHSLGRELGRNPATRGEGIALLEESLEYKIRNETADVAAVTNSLATVLSSDPKGATRAEYLLRRAISDSELPERDIAILQNSLAKLVSQDGKRFDEALDLFNESLAIGERLGLSGHTAQVLLAIAHLYRSVNPARSLAYLIRCLHVNHVSRNWRGVGIAEREIAFAVKADESLEFARATIVASIEIWPTSWQEQIEWIGYSKYGTLGGTALNRLAKDVFEKGEVTSARKYLSRARNIPGPQQWITLNNLGLVDWARGYTAGARYWWSLASNAPDSEVSSSAVDRLFRLEHASEAVGTPSLNT